MGRLIRKLISLPRTNVVNHDILVMQRRGELATATYCANERKHIDQRRVLNECWTNEQRQSVGTSQLQVEAPRKNFTPSLLPGTGCVVRLERGGVG